MNRVAFLAIGLVVGVGGSVMARPNPLSVEDRDAIFSVICERAKRVIKVEMEINERIMRKSRNYVDTPIAARAAAHIDSLATLDKIFCASPPP